MKKGRHAQAYISMAKIRAHPIIAARGIFCCLCSWKPLAYTDNRLLLQLCAVHGGAQVDAEFELLYQTS
jgi:hypothetical protein